MTVVFSAPVTGFTSSDITPGNATVTGFAGSGANYSFNLVPAIQGVVTADIAADVARDAASNGNTAAVRFTRVYTPSPAPDVDNSGVVDGVDLQLVIRAALGLPTAVNADVNRDGNVNAVDVQWVINAALGLSSK